MLFYAGLLDVGVRHKDFIINGFNWFLCDVFVFSALCPARFHCSDLGRLSLYRCLIDFEDCRYVSVRFFSFAIETSLTSRLLDFDWKFRMEDSEYSMGGKVEFSIVGKWTIYYVGFVIFSN